MKSAQTFSSSSACYPSPPYAGFAAPILVHAVCSCIVMQEPKQRLMGDAQVYGYQEPC